MCYWLCLHMVVHMSDKVLSQRWPLKWHDGQVLEAKTNFLQRHIFFVFLKFLLYEIRSTEKALANINKLATLRFILNKFSQVVNVKIAFLLLHWSEMAESPFHRSQKIWCNRKWTQMSCWLSICRENKASMHNTARTNPAQIYIYLS